MFKLKSNDYGLNDCQLKIILGCLRVRSLPLCLFWGPAREETVRYPFVATPYHPEEWRIHDYTATCAIH